MICRNCKNDISSKVMTCPYCGVKVKKKHFLLWFLLIILILWGFGFFSPSASKPNPATIDFQQVNFVELFDALDENAYAAKSTYMDMYVEFSGFVRAIDSDGVYFSVVPDSDYLSLKSVHCSVDKELRETILTFIKVDSDVTVRAQIYDVGEILGYIVDVYEVEVKEQFKSQALFA